jgi:excisionase family DNA binding protein
MVHTRTQRNTPGHTTTQKNIGNRKPAKAQQRVSVPPALLTCEEAAGYLGMSRAFLCKLIARGDIKSIVLGRKFRRVPLKACDAWIEEQTGVA